MGISYTIISSKTKLFLRGLYSLVEVRNLQKAKAPISGPLGLDSTGGVEDESKEEVEDTCIY